MVRSDKFVSGHAGGQNERLAAFVKMMYTARDLLVQSDMLVVEKGRSCWDSDNLLFYGYIILLGFPPRKRPYLECIG